MCKYETHFIQYNTQLGDILDAIDSLASRMLTHKITDPCLLHRYTRTITHDLQGQETMN